MASKKTEVATTTYIMTLQDGSIRKITIPSTWKMTFGSLVPYQQGKGHPVGGETRPYGLRLYEGSEKNLRAVFSDVIAIRDASIEISEKRTSVKRQVLQRQTKNGAKDVMVEAAISEWVNPDSEESDSPDPDFLRLGSDSGDF